MKLSICIIIYNHAKYIEECLNGILIQKTDFDIELIISDDCSTDNSRQVIDSFLALTEIPANFSIMRKYHTENVGMNRNWKYAIEQASGDFITVIEGDDYWTDASKMRQQVNFLVSHPTFSAVASEIGIVNDAGVLSGQFFTSRKIGENRQAREFKIGDYLKLDCLFHTSSLVYRNTFRGTLLPDLVLTAMSLDQAVFILFNPLNRIWFIPERMGDYRVHPGGITQSSKHRNLKKVTNNQISMFNALNVFTEYKFDDVISLKLRKLKFDRFKIGLGLPHIKRYIKRLSE